MVYMHKIIMPPRKRPAWVDPVTDAPAPSIPKPPRSQYVHPEDDPNYKGNLHKRMRERPAWDCGVKEPDFDPNLHGPVWAQEVVTLNGSRMRVPNMDEYVHPEDDPNYRGPPRPDFERSYVDPSWRGRKVDCPSAAMIWRCTNCLAEWQTEEATMCPRCKSKTCRPQATYGMMFPLIEAMQMINDGEDPRDGRIDERLDFLMKEQIEAVGGSREPVVRPKMASSGRKRVIVVESKPAKKDESCVYLTAHELQPGEPGSRCKLCTQPLKCAIRSVKLECGDIFHASCISQHLKKKDSCPVCSKKVE